MIIFWLATFLCISSYSISYFYKMLLQFYTLHIKMIIKYAQISVIKIYNNFIKCTTYISMSRESATNNHQDINNNHMQNG